MRTLKVEHSTLYRYTAPVTFGAHRLMFRPRDSHDQKLLDASFSASPAAELRWYHDPFGNSIAIATFAEAADELRLESTFRVEHYGIEGPDYPLEPFARTFPFAYTHDEMPDLARTIERHYADPDRHVDAWARRFVRTDGTTETMALLTAMTKAVKSEFGYARRDDHGTRPPLETLALGEGSCRDYALLLMEAARALGLAARFVTGYLYDPDFDAAGADSGGVVGAGATHAWTQIYLPGAGWVEFDPTNGQVGGTNLIRVAVARDPRQAVPVSGSFAGPPGALDALEVSVRVTAES